MKTESRQQGKLETEYRAEEQRENKNRRPDFARGKQGLTTEREIQHWSTLSGKNPRTRLKQEKLKPNSGSTKNKE
jgi:hypothetical protein